MAVFLIQRTRHAAVSISVKMDNAAVSSGTLPVRKQYDSDEKVSIALCETGFAIDVEKILRPN
jgi:hypothetical protein